MSRFLQLPPRPLAVALADYVALTGEDDLQRRCIASRVFAALPREQQAEISRTYQAMSSNAWRSVGETGAHPGGRG